MGYFFKRKKGSGSQEDSNIPLDLSKLRRERLIFHGRVQGVGFRYTAYQIARECSLTGWARNEYDGSVTVEVQGSESGIEDFINALGEQRFINISELERIVLDPIEEKSFRVTYS